LQGNARIEFLNSETISLKNGDYLFIPAHKKHRVMYTSAEPLCIWLAVFA
jgi:cupin 2 domain-containing protein